MIHILLRSFLIRKDKVMKLGEIKTEALKLMFAAYDRDLGLMDTEDLRADSAFRDYLYNMPPAINRAFSVIENRGVLRELVTEYSPSGGVIAVPEHIEAESGKLGGELTHISYKAYSCPIPFGDYIGKADGNVLLPSIVASERYLAHYAPRICRITSVTPDEVDIPIPDSIASLIPYYVKGELYREEDASEADVARAWFTAGLNEIVNRDITPTGVSTVYGGLI